MKATLLPRLDAIHVTPCPYTTPARKVDIDLCPSGECDHPDAIHSAQDFADCERLASLMSGDFGDDWCRECRRDAAEYDHERQWLAGQRFQ